MRQRWDDLLLLALQRSLPSRPWLSYFMGLNVRTYDHSHHSNHNHIENLRRHCLPQAIQHSKSSRLKKFGLKHR